MRSPLSQRLIDTVVEKVWTLRANLVENLRTQKFFVGVTFRQFGGLPLWMAPSRGASLDPLNALRKINRRLPRAISSDAPPADPCASAEQILSSADRAQ